MIYSNPTTKEGIVQDAYFEASADSVSYPIEDVTRNANLALDNVVALILGEDGEWQFDDKNATDLPIGATDLISGQGDYSFDSEYLTIKSLEIKDPYGNWHRLIPVDNNDYPKEVAMSQIQTGTGVPTHYDKLGDSFILIPTPNYNQRLVQEGEAGLRAYFQRKISYFATTDTTKEPGFAKHLHKYISLYIAYAFAKAKGLAKQVGLKKDMEFYEGNTLRGGNDKGAIAQFYSKRELDKRPTIKNNVSVKR